MEHKEIKVHEPSVAEENVFYQGSGISSQKAPEL
jgi:hypothetical protein